MFMHRSPHLLSLLSISALLAACGGGGGGGDSAPAATVPSLTVVADASAGGGTRVAAQFHEPAGVAVDSSGNVYVADTVNNIVRKISASGVVSTLAGSAGVAGSANGSGSLAQFNAPGALAVDAGGNVYVADTGNSTIRVISAAGVVSTLAGHAGAVGSANGNGGDARFNLPYGVAVDGSGNIYVADTGNDEIRKITAAGVVSTLAGTAGIAGSANTADGTPSFDYPIGIAASSSGVVYVADTGNHTIRKITAAGVVTTLAGTAGTNGSVDDTGAAASFESPYGVAVDAGGTVYVADTGNSNIRQITSGGVVTTLAGMGFDSAGDGTAASAGFSSPNGLAVGPSGSLYIADTMNHTVRKLLVSTQNVSTYAGVTGVPGLANGGTHPAVFNTPMGAVLDGSGNLVVADTGVSTLRKVTPAGVLSTWIGMGVAGFGNGTVATAEFNAPAGMAFDNNGILVLADTGNHVIRKVTSTPSVSTFAGTPEIAGSDDGSGSVASFASPSTVAVGSDGVIYVADTDNNTIRTISTSGVVHTLAGVAGEADSDDGACLTAHFNAPQGIAIDAAGNLYVADTGNNTIRKITRGSNCQITTVAGDAGIFGSDDGTGTAAHFNEPLALAVDGNGNVLVADFNNGIRKVTAAGAVTTLVSVEDEDGHSVFPNPSGISTRGSAVVVAAGNLVFIYQ
jgi:sugar lactone lactonase YvrE